MVNESRRKMQQEVCKKDVLSAEIVRMCEEAAEPFVDGLKNCESMMEYKAFTIRKFPLKEDGTEDLRMKHYVDLFTTAFLNAVDDNTDLHMTTFDLDQTIEDAGENIEIWFYAKKKEE
jgi:hypothetical protein